LDPSEGQDPVESRFETLAREEAECVANVDDGVARPRFHILPCAISRGEDLEAPLRCMEDRQRSYVGVHVLADLAGVLGSRRVVEEVQGALGALIIMVKVF